jgi:hypothetical protein
MVLGDVILFNYVATLGGEATTLGDGATNTLRSVVSGGGAAGWPFMMAVSCCMAAQCLILALAGFGTICQSCSMRSATVRMDLLQSNKTGT